jgi:hypothetical protein
MERTARREIGDDRRDAGGPRAGRGRQHDDDRIAGRLVADQRDQSQLPAERPVLHVAADDDGAERRVGHPSHPVDDIVASDVQHRARCTGELALDERGPRTPMVGGRGHERVPHGRRQFPAAHLVLDRLEPLGQRAEDPSGGMRERAHLRRHMPHVEPERSPKRTFDRGTARPGGTYGRHRVEERLLLDVAQQVVEIGIDRAVRRTARKCVVQLLLDPRRQVAGSLASAHFLVDLASEPVVVDRQRTTSTCTGNAT